MTQQEETIGEVLARWVHWLELVGKRLGPCGCGQCTRCEARAALGAGPETQRLVLVRLLDSVSFHRFELLRPCDCGQCLECQARKALGGERVELRDRSMQVIEVRTSRGKVRWVRRALNDESHRKSRHNARTCGECQLRAAHPNTNPIECAECGTVSRYWNGHQWRCRECMRIAKVERR